MRVFTESAHPALESSIVTLGSGCPDCITGISGNLSISFPSTENPKPVPHIKTYKHSAKASTLFILAKEQL